MAGEHMSLVGAAGTARPRFNHTRVAGTLTAVVIGSLLFVTAQPRLYRAFCEWTGIYDVDRAEEASKSAIPGRPVTMEFDANMHDGALRFRPETSSLSMKTGEIVQVMYRVENTLDTPVIGQAVPSYGPKHAGGYVKKLDCFCFRQQTFAPHEVREMPVVFALDPKLPEDVTTITLSYTFFEIPAGSVTKPAAQTGSRT